jgi:hexosaminidase
LVAKQGKQMVGWEEISRAPIDTSTVIQVWKSSSPSALGDFGARIVLSIASRLYLDMKYTRMTEPGLDWAGYVDVRDVYDWDPGDYLRGTRGRRLLGVEAVVWTETLRNIGAVEYMTLPRLPAVAELGWTSQATRNWSNFRSRIAAHAARWHYLGLNFNPSEQIDW